MLVIVCVDDRFKPDVGSGKLINIRDNVMPSIQEVFSVKFHTVAPTLTTAVGGNNTKQQIDKKKNKQKKRVSETSNNLASLCEI